MSHTAHIAGGLFLAAISRSGDFYVDVKDDKGNRDITMKAGETVTVFGWRSRD